MPMDFHEAGRSCDIDPDVLDLLIQSLSILSNVATLASTWVMLRGRPGGPNNESARDHIRTNLRTLRRALEDSFDAVESVLRIIEESERGADNEGAVLASAVRFGHNVMLNATEYSRVNQFLQSLDMNAGVAKGAARSIQMLAIQTSLHVIDLNFDAERFVAQLNASLFESESLGEAMQKLRLAQREAEDFVSDLERALRRN